jgi:cytochrome c biogenesis protein ResB
VRDQSASRVPWNTLRRVWRLLLGVDVAAVLILVALCAAALGSLLPYRWTAPAGGAPGWPRSPLFLAPVLCLALATLACLIDRWRRVWPRVFQQSMRLSDLAPGAASCTDTVFGLPAASTATIVRERLQRQGLRVRSEIAEGRTCLRGDRNRLGPLGTLANHLALFLVLLGAILSSAFAWREELAIAPGGTMQVGRGTRLALRNESFSIERYADGSVAEYEAQVALSKDGAEVAQRSVRINDPWRHGGIGFHLQGFEQMGSGYSVTLLAVYDPGYGVVLAAGLLLLFGLILVLLFPYRRLYAQIEPDGTLRLAGQAARQAHDFAGQFAKLVEELRDMAASAEATD